MSTDRHEFDIEVIKNKIRVKETPRSKDLDDIEVDLDPIQLETIELLNKLMREARLKGEDEYKIMGKNLYSILLDNEIGEAINRAYLKVGKENYLLIKLSFKDNDDLASLPWEYLYRPEGNRVSNPGFLADQTRLILTRNIRLDIEPAILTVDELPLKVLFVAPSPKKPEEKEGGLPPVEYEAILEKIKSFKSDQAKVFEVYELIEPEEIGEEGPEVTWDKFEDTVGIVDPHIIHFVGHGRYEGDHGQIAFMNLDYHPRWINDSQLADLLTGESNLKLVFLQACESGLLNPYQGFSGVAVQLAYRNIPAVVAMQYKIKQDAASEFAQEFYSALIDNNTIEKAVQLGRHKIAGKLEGGYAFGLPVLYMRESGRLVKSSLTQKEVKEPVQTTSRGQIISPTSSGEKVDKIICPWDGTDNIPQAIFCRKCGRDLYCSKGHLILQEGDYCQICRVPLRKETAEVEKIETAFIVREKALKEEVEAASLESVKATEVIAGKADDQTPSH